MITKEQISEIKQKLRLPFENVDTWRNEESFPQIGLGIIDINRFDRRLNRRPKLIPRIFTIEEAKYCRGNIESLAGRLAAKRAVLDALEIQASWQHVSIVKARLTRQPLVKLSRELVKNNQLNTKNKIPLSISHEKSIAVAFAVYSPESSTNLRLGTDIASVDRVTRAKNRRGDRFLEKNFTPAEIDQSDHDIDLLTAGWAAKEAVSKVLGTGFLQGVRLIDIEVLAKEGGLYEVNLSGNALKHASKKSINNWGVSIIPDPQTPVAFVIGY